MSSYKYKYQPINELCLKTQPEPDNNQVYTTTYNNTFSTVNTDSQYSDRRASRSSNNLTTYFNISYLIFSIKQYNDKKNENTGVKIFKEKYGKLDFSNLTNHCPPSQSQYQTYNKTFDTKVKHH